VTVKIGVYDDHAASAGSDELVYALLCDGCAAEREGDVSYLDTMPAGEAYSCEVCGLRNREEEED
jgi:hypothetical protein